MRNELRVGAYLVLGLLMVLGDFLFDTLTVVLAVLLFSLIRVVEVWEDPPS